MPKIADLPEFDMADYLDNDEAVAQYLSVVLAEGELADALGVRLMAVPKGAVAQPRQG